MTDFGIKTSAIRDTVSSTLHSATINKIKFLLCLGSYSDLMLLRQRQLEWAWSHGFIQPVWITGNGAMKKDTHSIFHAPGNVVADNTYIIKKFMQIQCQ